MTEGADGYARSKDCCGVHTQRQVLNFRLIRFINGFGVLYVRFVSQGRLPGGTSSGTASRLRTRTAYLLRIAAAITLVMWVAGCQQEPLYQGKPVTYWLDQLDLKPDASEPREALRQIGTNAIPILINRLRSKAPLSSRLVERYSFRWNWARRENERGEAAANRRRASAAIGFVVLGDSARDSVPTLLKLIRSERIESTSISAMVDSVGAIGPAASEAVPCLVGLLPPAPCQYFTRRAACEALGSIHSKPELAIPALIKATSGHPWIRPAAVEALAQFGEDARPALRVFEQGLQDPDENVRQSCTNALRSLGVVK